MNTKKNPIAEMLECIPVDVQSAIDNVNETLKAYGLPDYTELIQARIYYQEEAERKDEYIRHARESCACTAEGISEMVRALECDFDRLEELKDERQTLIDECIDAIAELDRIGAQSPADTESIQHSAQLVDYQEACERLTDAETALEVFQAVDGDELAELIADAGEFEDADEARTRIDEDPLEITLTGSWQVGEEKPEADKFIILLTTGGPAVRIVGELDRYNQASHAWIEYQDWFTPWVEYSGDAVSQSDLLTYCNCFYFGD